MGIFYNILNIIFPPICLICSKQGHELCPECLALCPQAERECAKWIYPLYDYRHPPIKKAISLLKYKNKRTLARIFAESLHGRIVEELSELRLLENFNNALIIPIPLSKRSYRERGYNQVELICEYLIKIDQNKHFQLNKNTLIKSKDTPHQAKIKDRNLRLKNLSGSFSVQNPDMIKGRNIILIDDVVTTGATLSEAKKTLRSIGAKKIIAFTVAH